MRVTEFYPEGQGRPYSPPAIPFEDRSLFLSPYSVRGIHLAGEFSRTTKTDNYDAADEMVILADASDSPITITLPAAATNSSKIYYIKKIDDSGNSVTIEGNALDETIDGEVEVVLTLQYEYVIIICDALDWYILGGVYVKMEDTLREQSSILKVILRALKIIATHLSYVTGANLKEEDLDA